MSWLQSIQQGTQRALDSGDLQRIPFDSCAIPFDDFDYKVCWVPNQDHPSETAKPFPGGPTDSTLNPFLPPDPMLTIGQLGAEHHVILNKFPVCDYHLVLPRIDFIEQRSPLSYADFFALSTLLCELGGVGFYNGGAEAGASQRHFHVQWLPEASTNPSLLPLVRRLDPHPIHHIQQHTQWSFKHAFMALKGASTPEIYAQELYQAHQKLCAYLGLSPDSHGYMPPFNLLIQRNWLLMVPRSQNQIQTISLNALSFAGVIYVREPEQLVYIQQQGISQLLNAVTT